MPTNRILLAAAAVVVLSTASWAQTVRPDVRINTQGLQVGNPVGGINVAEDTTSLGSYVAVWADTFGSSAVTEDIYFSRSDDNGFTWSPMLRIDTGSLLNTTDSELPKVVFTADGTIIVVWEDDRDPVAAGTPDPTDILYNRSTDGGLTWLPAGLPLNTMTAGPDVSGDAESIFIDVDGNNVYVTWEDDSGIAPGNKGLFFSKSTDAGATWTTEVNLNTAFPFAVSRPKVRANGNVVHITFVNALGKLMYLRSADGGVTWAAEVGIETNTNGFAVDAQLEINGDTVLVGWEDDDFQPGAPSIHAVVSTDGGLTWGPEEYLSPLTDNTIGSHADGTDMVIEGENMYVVYAVDLPPHEVFVSFSNDNGANWTVDVPIEPGQEANWPAIVATPTAVVVWDQRGPGGAHIPGFHYSTDHGATWIFAGEVPNAGPDSDPANIYSEGDWAVMSAATGAVIVAHYDDQTGVNEVYISGLDLVAGPIGMNYCGPAVPNSTAQPGVISAIGFVAAAANNVTLTADLLPPGQFGYFLASETQGFFNPPASSGFICLGGNIGRYNGNVGQGPTFSLQLDLTSIPVNPPQAAQAGDTWNFQCWYRDVGNTNNFTDGISIAFQ